eukprot:GHVR01177706.1.p1 GENE.GHVR01177706.1~~GHVR01177706.1.p1  ORF type:complete len:234 (+),score=14.95 GHVR01177706.1:210-911(+)
MYDFEKMPTEVGKGNWQDFLGSFCPKHYTPPRLVSEVVIGADLKGSLCIQAENDITSEVSEFIEMQRAKHGLGTLWEYNEEALGRMAEYLDNLSFSNLEPSQRHKLSREFDPGPDIVNGTESSALKALRTMFETQLSASEGRATIYSELLKEMDESVEEWKKYYLNLKSLWDGEFSKRNESLHLRHRHSFGGIPLHLSTAAPEKVKDYLVNTGKLRRLIQVTNKTVILFVSHF